MWLFNPSAGPDVIVFCVCRMIDWMIDYNYGCKDKSIVLDNKKIYIVNFRKKTAHSLE